MIFALIKTFFILIIGVSSGYFFQIILYKRYKKSDNRNKKLSVFLQKLTMLWLVSITYIGSLWVFNTNSISKILTMPFVGAFTTIIGGLYAIMLSKYLQYDSITTGSMFSSAYFGNQSILGGMICFFFLGEEGYALVPIFTFFIRLLYYGIGFPVAHMYSQNMQKQKSFRSRMIRIIKDPFLLVGIGAILIGLSLNFSSIERPVSYGKINEYLVPVNTFLLLFSIGLCLKLSHVLKYIRQCIYIYSIRFFLVPLSVFAVAYLLGYHVINEGLPMKVSLILSSMPVAFNAVIAANVYHLNIDMVNSCWIFSTVGLIFILPLLLYIINLI